MCLFVNNLTPTFGQSSEIFMSFFYGHNMTLYQVSDFLDHIYILFYFTKNDLQIQV
jgi:hypothetical protein